MFFFFNDTATTEIYTLSLHDALPICPQPRAVLRHHGVHKGVRAFVQTRAARSEEHTSELQSRLHLVCRLLLEKKIMVWSNFTATKCRGLVSLNQVIKEIICLQPLK